MKKTNHHPNSTPATSDPATVATHKTTSLITTPKTRTQHLTSALLMLVALSIGLGFGLSRGFSLTQGLFAQQSKNAHHAVSIQAKPTYPKGFTHFKYTNPNAPKGGKIILGSLGSFDSLNPFIIKGEAVTGLGNIYDTLTTTALDEKSVQYGLLAETIYYDDTRTWIAFKLHPKARWHDGKPVTPDDVIWTFNTLTNEGTPFYKFYYQNVKTIRKINNQVVRFDFTSPNQELPAVLAQLIILPKHYWANKDFSKTTLEPPLGSGPYKIKSLNAGKSITYERVKNYWAKDLPVAKGINNLDEIRYDYYQSVDIIREALRSGKIDFRQENNSKEWATGYDINVVKDGLLKKELIPDRNPQGLQGFIFNLRRSLFEDRRVREALSYAFDFEWSNRVLFYGAYTRSVSFFNNSELASTGLPSRAELAILNPYRDRLPEEVFTQAYAPPQTDGSGNNRTNLRKATALLKEAGWSIQNGVLTHNQTGETFEFTITLVLPAFERIVSPFIQNLERLGIKARINTINTAQYENVIQDFDFDMVIGSFGQSDSPGNEQRDFWGSAAAKQNGSRNIIGIENPVVDALIENLIAARTRKDLITATKALDRVLLWNHYVIPNWFIASYRVIYWDRFAQPEISPAYNLGFNTWWIDPQKDKALQSKFSFTR